MECATKLKAATKLKGALQKTVIDGAIKDALADGGYSPVYAAASLVPEDGWEWAR